jgi:peroxiredoxin
MDIPQNSPEELDALRRAWDSLTRRQREVVMLLGDGARPAEVAREWAVLPHAGFEVPAFSTSTLEGAPVTIGAAAAPATRQVLFVLRTTCPYCRATLPVWERIAGSLRRVSSPRIELYGISLDSAEQTREYGLANHLSYPLLTFPERKLVSFYRAVATPQTLVLDGAGRVLYARTGPLENSAVVDSIFRAATWLPSRADTVPLPKGTPMAGAPGRQ